MYLICYMTSHNHLMEKSYQFIGGSSLRYLDTLISHLTISTAIVGI